ncbi:MAG: S8 family serine peptidase [Halioglobus sp.]
MNKNTTLRNAVAAAVCTLTMSATAMPSGSGIPASNAEARPTAWFVQLSSPPGLSKHRQKTAASERKAFHRAAKAAGIKYKERRHFDTLWNGLSVNASSGEAGQLRNLAGVAGVWPVVQFERPTVQVQERPDLISAITMTGADIAHNELGYTGEGVKVAIMDTGLDVDNEDFGGDNVPRFDSPLFPSDRVPYGYDFVGDAYNADPSSPGYDPVPNPDSNPDDCQGHGTHVAGIVGANGPLVKGVAPDVTFGAYRVFGCEGSTDADIMIAAMEMALADGMDVLNMSIGSSFQWPQYPTAVAASNLVNEGMVVVASIGNSGDSGLYAAGAPGLGEQVIGTASIDNIESLSAYFEVAGEKTAYSEMTFAGPAPESGSEEYVYVGLACDANPLLVDPAGKSALISRGNCSFSEKASNAIDAGATSVVIHNNASGNFAGTLGEPIDGTTPVVSISGEDGALMKAQPGGSSFTWTDQTDRFPTLTAGLISSFSSYGLSPDLALKPDIAAPGGFIYSSYPVEKGVHATLGGTSMASPHVAGAAALVLEAKPETAATEMRAVLQNSADPSLLVIAPVPGLLEPVHRQGAGTVDIDDAILATTLVTPGKISAGESESGPYVQTLTIRNDGDSDVTYGLFNENAISTSGLTDDIGWWFSDAAVNFDQESVTVGANSMAYVEATIMPATDPDPDLGAPFGPTDFGIYGGYITMVPDDGGEVLRVPYAGFVGDYQRIQGMAPGAYGLPALAVLIEEDFFPVGGPDDWVFSMEGSDVPFFLMHFDHQVEYLISNIYHAESGEPVHPVYHHGSEEYYLPRNDSAYGFFPIPWDGSRMHSNGAKGKGNDKQKRKFLPNGNYVMEIRALKANGDRSNPEHWESWTSPVIAIARSE